MKLSMISSLALAAAMMVSTGAFAQDAMTPAAPTMIGGQTVSAEDLPKVQAQCNTLAGLDVQSLASDSMDSEGDGAEPEDTQNGETPDDSSTTNDNNNNTDGTDVATSKVDLALITIEECKAAGLAM
jgi:hypothetical protein